MTQQLIINTTGTPFTRLEDIPQGVRQQLPTLVDGLSGKLRVINASVSQSYQDRAKSICDAARKICQVFTNENNNERLKDNLIAFAEYIDELQKDHTKFHAEGHSLKERKERHVELIKVLEKIVLERIIPHLPDSQYAEEKTRSKKFARGLISKAEEYNVLTTERPILMTLLKDEQSQRYIIQAEVPQVALSVEAARDFLHAIQDDQSKPVWYQGMSSAEKVFFNDMMKGLTTPEQVVDRVKSISSMTRSIPAVANFSRHVIAVLNEDGSIHTKAERYRSSMVSSRDVLKMKIDNKKDKNKLREDFARRNIEKIIEEYVNHKYKNNTTLNELAIAAEIQNTPILIQTLITPIGAGLNPLIALSTLLFKKPDKDLFDDKMAAMSTLAKNGCALVINGRPIRIERFDQLIATNHPLNPGRRIAGTGRMNEYKKKENQEAIKKVIDIGARVSTSNPSSVALKAAAGELDSTNNAAMRKGGLEENDHELHMAGLEEFIVSRSGGLSCGSCVSGKDRKAVEVIYADAIDVFYALEMKMPELSGGSNLRTKFVSIYADLFVSRHQHLNAGQNAPGSDGIKTPDQYLPDDIKEAIIKKSKQDIFKESQNLANNNDNAKLLKKPINFRPEALASYRDAFGDFQPDADKRIGSSTTSIVSIDIKYNQVLSNINMPSLQTFPPPPSVKLTAGRVRMKLSGASVDVKSKDTLPEGHGNVCDIVCRVDDQLQQMRCIETDNGTQAKSTVMHLPDRCHPVKAWALALRNFQIKFPDNDTNLKEMILGSERSLESRLLAVLPNKQVKYLMSEYNALIYGNSVGAVKLPSDDITLLAISQVENLRRHKPNEPLYVKTSISDAYVKAALLYCSVSHYTLDVADRFKHLAPTKPEIEEFKKLLLAKIQLFEQAKNPTDTTGLAPLPGVTD